MTTFSTFEELFRDCRESAVHLEMRDACMKSDPAYIDWDAGAVIDPGERWADWLALVTEARSRGVRVRRARIVSEPVSKYIRFEHEVTNGLNIAAGEEVRWLPHLPLPIRRVGSRREEHPVPRPPQRHSRTA